MIFTAPTVFAATTITALYVMQDLMSVTPTAQTMTVSSLTAQWLTDQLFNNTAAVSGPNTTEQFVALPRADGAAAFAFSLPPGSSARLAQSAAGAFQYLSKDGVAINFGGSAPAGALESWTFPNGMAVNLSYSGSKLSQITNPLGRSLTLTYSGDDLTAVTDDTGRSVAYGYDGVRNLLAFTDPLGAVTEFRYDASGTYDTEGRLTQFIYPFLPGNPFLTNWYDPMGRVVQQANANGALSTLYLAGSRSELVDAVGNTHVTYQTDRGRVLKDAWVLSGSPYVFNYTPQTDGVVNVTTHQYDGLDRPVLTTFPEGNSVATAYDGATNPWANNVASVTRNPKPGSPLSATVTSFTYDSLWNKPATITDALGRVSRLAYGPATGNLLATVADAGTGAHFNVTSRFTYNATGQVLTVTDALGTVTASAYDGAGNLVSVTADSGTGKLNLATAFAHDALGNVTAVTDPRSNTSIMTYDAARRLVTTTGPPPFNTGALLVRTTNAYDADGHLLSVTRANGSGSIVASTAHTATGKVASSTDPNGNITRYAYDAADRLTSVTQPAAGSPRITGFTYDALGRTTAIHNTAIQAGALEQYAYTPNGRQATFTDANGNVTAYAYDGFDRLTKTTYAQGTALASSESLTYDVLDNVLTRTTRRNDVIAFTYDTLNRRTAMTPPAGTAATTYSYDLLGRLTGVSSNGPSITKAIPPSGNTVQYATTLTYDQLNRPTAVSWDPVPSQSAPSAASVEFTHGYSAANQRISQAVTNSIWLGYPAGAGSTTYTANALNQYTAVNAVSPAYDANGNLIVSDTFDPLPTPTAGTTNYITDEARRMVLEYDGATGVVRNWYAYGLGSNEVLNRMDVAGGNRQTLIPDVQGSVMATLDSSGTLSKRGYLPFGGDSTSNGAFAYTGQYLDASGLYNYRARVYSPALGRFPQPDPAGYVDGGNLYAYTLNDPLNATDPSGLDTSILIGYTKTPVPGTYHQFVILTDTVTGQQFATRAGPASQSISGSGLNSSASASGGSFSASAGNAGSGGFGFGQIVAQSSAFGPGFRDPPSSMVARQEVGTIPRDFSASVANAINFRDVTNKNAIPYWPSGPNSNSYASTFVESLTGSPPTPILNAPGYEMGKPSGNLSYTPSSLINTGGATGSWASGATGNAK